jgi:hypothetical protein
LVTKRNKVAGMRKSNDDQDLEHSTLVSDLQEKERNRRLKMARTTTIPSSHSIDKLKEELDHELDTDILLKKMPRWMKLSADAMIKEADEVHSENASLSKVLIGYNQRAGGGGM